MGSYELIINWWKLISIFAWNTSNYSKHVNPHPPANLPNSLLNDGLNQSLVLHVRRAAIWLQFSSFPSPLDLATSEEDKADEIRH